MINQHQQIETMENEKKDELEIEFTNSLKNHYLDNDIWKMRINMLSDLKNKESQMRNERLIEMVCSNSHY